MIEQSQSNGADRYIDNHGYSSDDFLQQGEESQFNGLLVLDESGSGKKEEFEGFKEMNQSDWSINSWSAARLTDGTILYEGNHE